MSNNMDHAIMNKPFAFNGKTYQWLSIGHGYELRTGGRSVARVVPDVAYPSMYRVERDGKLSDVANLSRAKDAALSLADRAIETRARPVRRSPIARTKKGATAHPAAERPLSDRRRAPVNPHVTQKSLRQSASEPVL
jgi:hypothetical protein